MSRRERMEARADRLREWAEKRQVKAAAVFKAGEPFTSDIAFNTQPGHIPFRARLIAREDRAHESLAKAANMESRAAGIDNALDRSIFSDDADAIEQLEARIAEREAERDRIKRYNVTCKAAAKRGESHGDLSILDESQKNGLLTTMRVASYQIRPGGAFPAYVLSNLAGRIKADRDRIEVVKRRVADQERAEANGGVSIQKFLDSNWCQVTFAEKPSRAILDALRGAGYGYSRGTWCGYLNRFPLDDAGEVRS